ncbi:Na/Pi cotransporter family protein [Agrobacterium sp. SHOUNA12C]|uniref:Sodium-dependent phosphate transporter protein n=2 Tax=Rhizobium rhizogenes TaxID=359 RepID=B9J7B0_RHIR8|nr:Na/Pi cotransporter family protein [Rhizobium rhizogenes]ACM27217.1 sodium-dependent phosphate transporter protein [Rhizobium rhizogenes K84]MCJ9719643.1 Na/Pi cotransporter family protein [Agrobacterium sp. BETTINA12B]MCJ9755422.1 Na/Pi cotransporter family protein [Agrobacterium sp. SHOUNA12C]KEA06188.1 sodium:phosphate symporter [Rhizobium rhizogenes]MDJ1635819.1 Na/Pi cotransporter family protein [Rhizobium rhizogenes]
MESTVVMINLFGAVALLLFGLAQVKDGVSRAFGARLRTGLASGTRGGLRSFVSGFVATVALQSSTATALMIASFVERDLVLPSMAQIVLLGANVGTAVTAWIVATGIEWLSPLIILIGIVLYRRSATTQQGAGTALIGIGLMLLSLQLLSLATEPMRQSPALAAFIGLLDGALPVALIFSAVLAFVSSSSLAVVVLILSLASAGILSPALTVVLVLGANLGGAIPPVMATLSGPATARRVTLGNLIVRTIGCLIVLPFASYIGAWMQGLHFSPAKLPVDVHLLFNIALAICAWPFSSFLSKTMLRLVRDDPQADDGPKFLDHNALITPVVALASATREVLGVGDLIERMLIRTENAFNHNDLSPLKEIAVLEKRVDRIQQEVKIYLSKLGREGLDDENGRRSIVIIDYAINLEHIGDIIEKGLAEQVAKKIGKGLTFSDDGYQELHKLFGMTIDNLRIAQTIFVTRDFNLARQLMEVKVDVRRLEKQSSERHLERLRDGRVDSLQTSSLHLDMLRDLKRINAHIVSVAHPILDESGLLIESRLRNTQ